MNSWLFRRQIYSLVHSFVVFNVVQVDVQVRVNREMTQYEKNIYTAAVLAESAAKLAQSAASYGEEVSEGLRQQWVA